MKPTIGDSHPYRHFTDCFQVVVYFQHVNVEKAFHFSAECGPKSPLIFGLSILSSPPPPPPKKKNEKFPGVPISRMLVMLVMFVSYCVEAGGSDVNPDHEPHMPKGGITAEMQVSHYLFLQ